MTGGRKEFRGKETGATVKCQGQGKCLREDICKEKQSAGSKERILGERDMSRSELSRTRKEFRGKEMGAETKCHGQGKN